MSYSIFTPYVNVDDDGTISTEWFDCHIGSYDSDSFTQLDENIEAHSEVLDERLRAVRRCIARAEALTGTESYVDLQLVLDALVKQVRPFFATGHFPPAVEEAS